MQPPAAKDAGRRNARDRASKDTQGAETREEHANGAPAGELPMPGWTLTPEGLAAMHPAQCHRHLLFCDLLEDVGAAASIFPRESVELGYRMPDLRAWTQSLELPAARQDRLFGLLKAAEARGRIRALRLRYNHLRVRPGAQREGRAGENWGEDRERRPARDPEERELEDPRGLAAGGAGQGNTSRWLRGTPTCHAPARRRRRSRSSSSGRSPRAPPSGWSCSCLRS